MYWTQNLDQKIIKSVMQELINNTNQYFFFTLLACLLINEGIQQTYPVKDVLIILIDSRCEFGIPYDQGVVQSIYMYYVKIYDEEPFFIVLLDIPLPRRVYRYSLQSEQCVRYKMCLVYSNYYVNDLTSSKIKWTGHK